VPHSAANAWRARRNSIPSFPFPDTSISGGRVARELTAIIERRGKPAMIVSDKGTELTLSAILGWCAAGAPNVMSTVTTSRVVLEARFQRDASRCGTASWKASTGACAMRS
jgi:hypothetical protein